MTSRRKIKRVIKPALTKSTNKTSSPASSPAASPPHQSTTSIPTTHHHHSLKHIPEGIDPYKISPPPTSSSKSHSSPQMRKFLLQYNAMKDMREENPAPVDTMGCHVLHDKQAVPKTQRFHTLVSLLLSAQTKDAITAKAMHNLKKEGLTVDNVLSGNDALDDENAQDIKEGTCQYEKWSMPHIEQMIYPVSFFKRKARYMKKIARILRDDYDGDIPRQLSGLLKLPGIGPKMGHLIMTHAWHDTQGIGVDVHVHRISNRFEWVDTKSPEETRKALEKWLPKEYWEPINEVMVGFGQTICAARPKCGKCLMGGLKGDTDVEESLCPYYEKLQLGEEIGGVAKKRGSKGKKTKGGTVKRSGGGSRKRRKMNPPSDEDEDL
uniref:Endonuclease III homolog n=1 Tax=Percolomonas cosmopolitus TaxID=63605 RepID=A0A7S1KQT6_9EUKA|eukprot:CAMPEP_0117442306 /NCGR_PEP_ID=MMETSP0759-20121206/4082_1 /TAXON_ID=63605 /ORGANISM="Percolomonas cosmopolitus, Strain WS" /LENGTH=378 /DNA_ID=CAMNT_0005234187 /DNA_START=193 /DNA_END=1329 /DNA_ORIENTATION=+